jgi:hypothetical protein
MEKLKMMRNLKMGNCKNNKSEKGCLCFWFCDFCFVWRKKEKDSTNEIS